MPDTLTTIYEGTQPTTGTSGGGGGGGGGDGVTITEGDARWLKLSENGADIPNVATFRGNIGLGEDDDVIFATLTTDTLTTDELVLPQMITDEVLFVGVEGVVEGSANMLFDGTDLILPSASFGADNALTGSLGDARYGQLGEGNVWTALNTFQGNNERIRLDGENAFISSFNSGTRQGFIQWNETLDTETILRIASEEGRIELLTGLSGNEQLALSLGSNQDADFQNNIQVSGTTVIDSSRNFFGVNADFSGTLDVDGVSTFNITEGAGDPRIIIDKGTKQDDNIALFGYRWTGGGSNYRGWKIEQFTSDGMFISTATGAEIGSHSWNDAINIAPEGDVNLLTDITYFEGIQSDSFNVVGGLITGTDISQAGAIRTASIEANAAIFKSFTAEVSQLFRGETTLSKSFAEIAEDFVIPAVSSTQTLTIKDVDGFAGYELFAENDIVEIRPFVTTSGGMVIGSVFGEVTGFTDNMDGTQSWTFETLFTQNGALAGQTAYAGSEAKSYGSAASPVGVIQDSVFANTPYRQIYTWATNPWTVGNRTILYHHGDLDEAGIANVTGIGVYSANAYFTESFIVGDLSKAGNYMEFASNELTVIADSYKFESANMLIDSATEVIDIGTAHHLDGLNNEVIFSNGILTATATEVGLASFTADSDSLYNTANSTEISMGYPTSISTTVFGFHAVQDSSNRLWMGHNATLNDLEFALFLDGEYLMRVNGSDQLIGGWNLEPGRLFGGEVVGEYTGMQSGAGSTKAFFAGADDEDGTNALAYIRADGYLFSPSISDTISMPVQTTADYERNPSPAGSFTFDDNWSAFVVKLSDGTITTDTPIIVKRYRFRKKPGATKATFSFWAKREDASGSASFSAHRAWVRVEGTGITNTKTAITASSYTKHTVETEFSTADLFNEIDRIIDIKIEAEVEVSGYSSGTFSTELFLNDNLIQFEQAA